MKLSLENVAGMLNEDLISLQEQVSDLTAEIIALRQAQEVMLLRMGQYAYKIDFDELKKEMKKVIGY
jgi:hypothetical protein